MRVITLCFSPTGGTKRALQLLTEGWSVDSQMDLCVRPPMGGVELEEGDVAFLAVPSFGGRVPAIALENLRQVRANGARAVIVVSFGNRAYDDTLLELKNEAAACGFRVVAAVATVTEHSIMREYGAGRPDEADAAELRDFSSRLQKLLGEGASSEVAVPGNQPYREYHGVPLKPKAGKSCTKCGACAKECPAGAIPQDDPARTDGERCISCMRCIQVCPQHARSLNSALLLASSLKMKKVCSGRKHNELFAEA